MKISELQPSCDGAVSAHGPRTLGRKALASSYARELYRATSKDRRYVKRLRKLGASNYEIANALGIPEDAPVLHE